jgi:hypothetical protein
MKIVSTMKKKILCLMIACLSLFAIPNPVQAGTIAAPKENTELPVLPPVVEKKLEQFKKKHPGMFSKKDIKAEENTATESQQKAMGIIGFVFSVSLLVVIALLLIIFL